jgi:hypothetical protein
LPSNPTESQIWRYLAQAGGPFVLDVVVGDFLNTPDTSSGERHVMAEKLRWMVRFMCTPDSDLRAQWALIKQGRQLSLGGRRKDPKTELLRQSFHMLERLRRLRLPRNREPLCNAYDRNWQKVHGMERPVPSETNSCSKAEEIDR